MGYYPCGFLLKPPKKGYELQFETPPVFGPRLVRRASLRCTYRGTVPNLMRAWVAARGGSRSERAGINSFCQMETHWRISFVGPPVDIRRESPDVFISGQRYGEIQRGLMQRIVESWGVFAGAAQRLIASDWLLGVLWL